MREWECLKNLKRLLKHFTVWPISSPAIITKCTQIIYNLDLIGLRICDTTLYPHPNKEKEVGRNHTFLAYGILIIYNLGSIPSVIVGISIRIFLVLHTRLSMDPKIPLWYFNFLFVSYLLNMILGLVWVF